MSEDAPSWTGQFGNTMFGTKTRVSVTTSLGAVLACVGWLGVRAQEAYSTQEERQDAVLEQVPVIQHDIQSLQTGQQRIENKLDRLTDILLQERRGSEYVPPTTRTAREKAFSSE